MSEDTPGRYEPHAVEAARQAAWREREAFRTPALNEERPHLYIKPSAPFTSGNVHIGHVRSYSIGDAYARYRRARGEDVLFAFGFDAFGLPAELGAIAGGEPPSEWVDRCASHMTGQLQRLGFSFDWDRSFLSSDAIMYRWSQWLFLTLYEAGLVYRGDGHRRLVRSLPDDPGLDPGRGRRNLLALPQPGPPDRAAAVVLPGQRLRGGERRPADRARGERQMGQGGPRLAARRDGPGRRGRARAAGCRRLDGDRLHAPCDGAGRCAVRGPLPPPPRCRGLGRGAGGRRAARAAALRRLGAQRP